MDFSGSFKEKWQELHFWRLVVKMQGAEYEALFNEVMKSKFKDHYHAPRAAGVRGDHKCDGWDSESLTLYSVYAPSSQKEQSRVRKKIRSDFLGARAKWKEMQKWRFVHNDFNGLGGDVNRELQDLRNDDAADGVEILSDWGPHDLWSTLLALPDSKRDRILGIPPLIEFPDKFEWNLEERNFCSVIPHTALESSVRSVDHLCGNFHPEGPLNRTFCEAFSRTLASSLGEQQGAFDRNYHILMECCERYKLDASIGATVFVWCSLQIFAEEHGLDFRSIVSSGDHPFSEFSIVLELVEGNLRQLAVYDEHETRLIISACCNLVRHVIDTLSPLEGSGYFALQKILIRIQSEQVTF